MITRRLRVTAISRARRVPVESGPYLNRFGKTRGRGELNAGPTRLAVGAWAETGRPRRADGRPHWSFLELACWIETLRHFLRHSRLL